jgi:hypothetical protein
MDKNQSGAIWKWSLRFSIHGVTILTDDHIG